MEIGKVYEFPGIAITSVTRAQIKEDINKVKVSIGKLIG